MINFNKVLSSFLLIVLTSSCVDTKEDDNALLQEAMQEEQKTIDSSYIVSDDEMKLLLGTIPPPAQINALVSKKEYTYQKKYLQNVSLADQCKTSHKQAYFLGVYGSDLGYTQLYDQLGDGLVYFEAVYKLSEELGIEQYFDKKLMQDLSATDKTDSLLEITAKNFEQINTHFIREKSPELSVLVLTAGWLESTYLMAKNYEQKPSEELKNRIAEQQVALEVLVEVYKKFEKDDKLFSLNLQLKPLIDAFAKIEIVEKEIAKSVEHVWSTDGTMTISPNTETQIVVDKKDFDSILKIIISTRNSLFL